METWKGCREVPVLLLIYGRCGMNQIFFTIVPPTSKGHIPHILHRE